MSNGDTVNGKTASIWSISFIALIFNNFAWGTGTFLSNTVLPLYAYKLGATAAIVGIIVGTYAIIAVAIRPFTGPAFDSFSKKLLLAISVSICAVSMFAYALVSSVPLLIVIRMFNGIGIGCAGPLGMALASENLPRERLSSGIGYYTLANAVGQAVGPAAGIAMSQAFGFSVTFLFAGTMQVLGLIVLLTFVKDCETGERPPYKIELGRIFAKRAILPSIVLMLLACGGGSVNSFMAVYGELRGVAEIGLFFTVQALTLLVTRPVFGKLAERYGTFKVAVPAMCCFALSFILVSQSTSLPLFIIAALIGGCGFGATTPLINALIFKCVPFERRGAASNTAYMGQDIGNLVGPFIGGMFIDATAPALGSEVAAYSSMWLFMLIFILSALFLFVASSKRIKRYVEELNAAEGAK